MSFQAVLEEPMAKRNDVSVKIDAEVYRLVKTAASWQGKDIAEYLSEVAREAATRDISGISAELQQPEPKARRRKPAE
jgi:uncharacterized protein (DUF1778 family)